MCKVNVNIFEEKWKKTFKEIAKYIKKAKPCHQDVLATISCECMMLDEAVAEKFQEIDKLQLNPE